MADTRTSQSSPLRIDGIVVNVSGGEIGMTLCPGKQGPSVYDAPWGRSLDVDIRAIKEWGAVSLVTLMELQELSILGVPELGDSARQAGLKWFDLRYGMERYLIHTSINYGVIQLHCFSTSWVLDNGSSFTVAVA